MVLRLNWLSSFCLASSFLLSVASIGLAKDAVSLKFKKQKIELMQKKNKKIITVEIAEAPEQHAQGLMFRKKLKNNEGMLFIFNEELVREFWMKNTLINLDIGYFDKNKKLIDIQQMKAVTSIMQTDLPTYPSKQPAMYALEMQQAWFKKNKFTEGTEFKIISGP